MFHFLSGCRFVFWKKDYFLEKEWTYFNRIWCLLWLLWIIEMVIHSLNKIWNESFQNFQNPSHLNFWIFIISIVMNFIKFFFIVKIWSILLWLKLHCKLICSHLWESNITSHFFLIQPVYMFHFIRFSKWKLLLINDSKKRFIIFIV